MSQTGAKGPQDPPETLTDADISSERILKRRSFLSQTGLWVGGALAVAAGMRGASAAEDPDKDGDDPAPDKPADPDKKKHKHKHRRTDPDSKRATDPDGRRATDPDPKRPTDPRPPKTDPDP